MGWFVLSVLYCLIKINVLLNFWGVLTLFQNAGSQLCFIFIFCIEKALVVVVVVVVVVVAVVAVVVAVVVVV